MIDPTRRVTVCPICWARETMSTAGAALALVWFMVLVNFPGLDKFSSGASTRQLIRGIGGRCPPRFIT